MLTTVESSNVTYWTYANVALAKSIANVNLMINATNVK